MPIELKVDDAGNAVLQDGKPVYTFEDGKDAPFDVPAAMSKIASLNGEAKDYRLKLKDATENLTKFEKITDVDVALAAMKTVENIDDQKLVEAGKVEELKSSMKKIADDKEATITNEFTKKVGDLEVLLGDQETKIRKLIIDDKFNNSPFFSGEQPKTTLFPDVAAKYYGENFKIEDKDGQAKVIGYLKGEVILSKERFGEPAEFDEAMEYIIEHDPRKNLLLTASSGGSGGIGNLGGLNDDGEFLTIAREDAKDVDKFRNAKKKAAEKGLPLKIK